MWGRGLGRRRWGEGTHSWLLTVERGRTALRRMSIAEPCSAGCRVGGLTHMRVLHTLQLLQAAS